MGMVEEFNKVDQSLGSEEFKKENFGKYAKKYEYQSIVRTPPTDEDEEVTRPPYMKLKLDLTWPDSNVKTEVFSSELLDSGKRQRKKLDVETVTDFASHMPYMCKFRPVFRPVKMWAHQSKMKDPGYGIVFKLIKVEVEPSNNGNSAYQNYLQGDVFVDDEEDDVPTQSVSAAPTQKVAAPTVAQDDESEDSESSDSSDDDSDEEPVVKKSTSKKSSGKK